MTSTPSYPGVHLREASSGSQTIAGASTSVAAFVGWLPRGPLEDPQRVDSFEEFERRFGGLHPNCDVAYSVQQFFLNGGSEAWIVRIDSGETEAKLTVSSTSDGDDYNFEATSPGTWGDDIELAVYESSESDRFHLVVGQSDQTETYFQSGNQHERPAALETHKNLSYDSSDERFFAEVLEDDSSLIRSDNPDGDFKSLPDNSGEKLGDRTKSHFTNFGTGGTTGDDGQMPRTSSFNDSSYTNALTGSGGKTGLYALEDIGPYDFNILVLPDVWNLAKTQHKLAYSKAAVFCEEQDAFLVEATWKDTDTPTKMETWMSSVDRFKNAAVYYPNVEVPDPLDGYKPREIGAGGTIAGLYARTDASRGIWKAPAGTAATLRGADPAVNVKDPENGNLNELGCNVLRTFAGYGSVSWGARTLVGQDNSPKPDHKYVPVRRLTLYIKQSLQDGMKWVVFEPNGHKLWAQIRLTVNAFMDRLYRQGAFMGKSADQAYQVKCDSSTTTQDDINRGIVNIVVKFAPINPAEFVVITIQQMAGRGGS